MKMNTKTQKSGVKVKESVGSRIFTIINTLILAFLALICILPLINILAISLSSNAAATAGLVKLLPVDFTLKSYEYVAKKGSFLEIPWGDGDPVSAGRIAECHHVRPRGLSAVQG